MLVGCWVPVRELGVAAAITILTPTPTKKKELCLDNSCGGSVQFKKLDSMAVKKEEDTFRIMPTDY